MNKEELLEALSLCENLYNNGGTVLEGDDTFQTIGECIEKRTPKKPVVETHRSILDKKYKYKLYYCPYCRPRIEVKKQYSCCPGCGQVIDWG